MSKIVESTTFCEIRRGWLVLFLTSLFVGLCAGVVETAVIFSDTNSAQILSKIWPISLAMGIFFGALTWGLYRHAYQGCGTKIAQTVQVLGYIGIVMIVVGVFITVGSAFSNVSIEKLYPQIIAMLRGLPICVPFCYFLIYNYRLIRLNRRILAQGITLHQR